MKVTIAGGGTGGHLFVGIAVAEAIMACDPFSKVLFIGTKGEMSTSLLQKKGLYVRHISAGGIKGKGLWRQAEAMAKLPLGVLQAIVHLLRFRSDVVFGVGGYSSGPVGIVAYLMGIPVMIHEQNFIPGITNRLLARFSKKVFVSFPESASCFDKTKTEVSGNPVRQELLSRQSLQKGSQPFTVLVVGGSQGAQRINQVVVEALDKLKEERDIEFIHQTGTSDFQWVTEAYKKNGRSDKIEPFIHDMAEAYSSADIILCRAGATTISEICVLGKGAIFVPFPFATDNHQEFNARYLSDKGAGELILQANLSGDMLAQRILYYKSNRGKLLSMGEEAKKLGKPGAANMIANEILQLKARPCSARSTIYTL
ncbi:MAG: undecaprenyldiphospho-muramoylpentapeptide beta-N-acetylglucosaminyltransferase [Pseudomonadota bacterium]